MAVITLQEANAWCEPTKSAIPDLDQTHVAQVASAVFARLTSQYDTSLWTDATNTPAVVKTIIAMFYVSWHYDKAFSADPGHETDDYAKRLRGWAETLLVKLEEGTDIPGVDPLPTGQPAFYPNDASSALEPTAADPSLGPNKFSMGVIW
jgi:hypothetical protein